jgi:hypothetical protein
LAQTHAQAVALFASLLLRAVVQARQLHAVLLLA